MESVKKIEKDFYVSPTVLIVEVKTKGIICTSNPEGEGNGFPGGWN